MTQQKRIWDLISKDPSKVPAKLYHVFTNLTILYLDGFLDDDYEKIKFIPGDIFSGCTKLKDLDLSHHLIDDIKSPHTFSDCKLLEVVDLSYNRFTNITPIVQANFRDAKILCFDNNLITKSAQFHNYTNLTELNLELNKLSIISHKMFSDCIKLEKLQLNNNNITVIHQDAFSQCTNLVRLDLDSNQLKEIPHHMLVNCSKLLHLSLFSNCLEFLPETIANIVNKRDYGICLRGNPWCSKKQRGNYILTVSIGGSISEFPSLKELAGRNIKLYFQGEKKEKREKQLMEIMSRLSVKPK